jgi:hypothetical protein
VLIIPLMVLMVLIIRAGAGSGPDGAGHSPDGWFQATKQNRIRPADGSGFIN